MSTKRLVNGRQSPFSETACPSGARRGEIGAKEWGVALWPALPCDSGLVGLAHGQIFGWGSRPKDGQLGPNGSWGDECERLRGSNDKRRRGGAGVLGEHGLPETGETLRTHALDFSEPG